MLANDDALAKRAADADSAPATVAPVAEREFEAPTGPPKKSWWQRTAG